MKTLKDQLKTGNFGRLYLFYGPETYLAHSYLDSMVKRLVGSKEDSMNYEQFDGAIQEERILDALETLPFLAERRVVVLNGMDLFLPKNAKKVEKLASHLERIPDTATLFLLEKEVDKRSRLFKQASKHGEVVEFKHLGEEELVKHLARRLARHGKNIERGTARHFIETVGFELERVENELEKLVDYAWEEPVVTRDHIDRICSKNLENKVFAMVECLGTEKREEALGLFQDLMALKEPPTRILFLLSRQLRILLQVKLMAEAGHSPGAIASKIKLPPFVANKNLRQAGRFSKERLLLALNKCLEVELLFKQGRMDLEIGVQMILIENSGNGK
ncbi:DNA polymerase III subunit delta [Anaerotalea alkaliphila]|uniref:DNA polymerase III subunit delta n=1 Tax=Anaerotalea alkaliphila TaxID=2662126 RepID=A0A7X5KMN5_9FIRM|nr:DNA polymerase III subunit delta [Anaerotalea alkaliphila]NDL66903.1 DNA polymerase III subunit delta [Anaerotalea alkaliphila]